MIEQALSRKDAFDGPTEPLLPAHFLRYVFLRLARIVLLMVFAILILDNTGLGGGREVISGLRAVIYVGRESYAFLAP
jgi:hypothetical protein